MSNTACELCGAALPALATGEFHVMNISNPRPVNEVLIALAKAVDVSRRSEFVALVLAIACFVVGAILLAIGYQMDEWRILAPAAVVEGLIYWPINKILKIRSQTLLVFILPELLRNVSRKRAADILEKLIDKML